MAEHGLQLELVAADRVVWSGQTSRITARTVDGDIGVLPGHAPLLSVLAPCVVEVDAVENESFTAFVDGGFISVADGRVSVLAESVEMTDDIDLAKARAALDEARSSDDDEGTALAVAEARVRAAEQAG